MSNTSSIMAGAYFDQLIGAVDLPARAGLCIHPSVLQGSMFNPLRALRLITIDPQTGDSYDAETLAQLLDVPEEWLDDDHIRATSAELVPALGKMVLMYLSSLRSHSLDIDFGTDAQEDTLQAVATFDEVMGIGARLAGGRVQG